MGVTGLSKQRLLSPSDMAMLIDVESTVTRGKDWVYSKEDLVSTIMVVVMLVMVVNS